MSATTPEAPAKEKAKNKMLIVVLAVAVLFVVGGAAAWFLLAGRGGESRQGAEPKSPPTFLPIENMVVNLADPGGDRFAQVGITLELADAKTEALVKQYLPTIRSGILILLSQRTADELLAREGKEKLAQDIRREVARPLGVTPSRARSRAVEDEDAEEPEEEDAPRPRADSNPVRQVLFSSFIIQ